MNREDIIKLAREAGGLPDPMVFMGAYERFAALVVAAERDRIADEAKHIIKRAEARGAAAEREACAKVCESMRGECWAYDHDRIAAAIRARGQA